MQRRGAATTAGILTAIAAMAGIAIGANVGILRREPAEPVGALTPVSEQVTPTTAAAPEVVTVYVDEPATVPPASPQPQGDASVVTTAETVPVTQWRDDHRDGDDDHEKDHAKEGGHERGEDREWDDD